MGNITPKTTITIDQGTGEFYLVGNKDGLEYLRDSISKSLRTANDESDEIQLKLDSNITGDLKEIVVGNEAIDSTLEMMEFYNSTSNLSGNVSPKNRLIKPVLGGFKVIWFYILPIIGVYAIYYFTSYA